MVYFFKRVILFLEEDSRGKSEAGGPLRGCDERPSQHLIAYKMKMGAMQMVRISMF